MSLKPDENTQTGTFSATTVNEKPTVPKSICADIDYDSDCTRDRGRNFDLTLQADQRYVLDIIGSNVKYLYSTIEQKFNPTASPATLGGYCLALYHASHLANDINGKTEKSLYAQEFLTSPKRVELFRLLLDCKVPSFLEPVIQNLTRDTLPGKENARVIADYSCFKISVDFGRFVPICMLFKMHDLAASVRTNIDIPYVKEKWSQTRFSTNQNSYLTFSNMIATSMAFHAPDRSEYQSWFHKAFNQLLSFNTLRSLSQRYVYERTFAPVPDMIMDDTMNPYLFGLHAFDSVIHDTFINLNIIKNIIASNDFIYGTHSLRDYLNLDLPHSSINHMYTTFSLPTWSTIKYVPLPDDSKIPECTLLTPTEYAHEIHFLDMPPTIVQEYNNDAVLKFKDKYSNLETFFPRPVSDTTKKSSTSSLSPNVISGLKSGLMSSVSTSDDTTSTVSTSSVLQRSQTYTLKSSKKIKSKKQNTHKYVPFNVNLHVTPKTRVLTPFDSFANVRTSVVISGNMIESLELDAFGVPQPFATNDLKFDNQLFLQSAIPTKCLYQATNLRPLYCVDREQEHFADQNICIDMLEMGSAHYARLHPDNLVAPGFPQDYVDDYPIECPMPFSGILSTNRINRSVNHYGYYYREACSIPDRSIPAWSCYRYNGWNPTFTAEDYPVYHVVNLRTLYGLNSPLYEIQHPSDYLRAF